MIRNLMFTRTGVVALAIASLLGGCATAPPPREDQLAYVSAKLEDPKVCLAFSGGGVRSAAVSIGAISELAREGMLQEVDLASGASGGGWALAWLYSNTATSKDLASVVGTEAKPNTKALERIETAKFLAFSWRVWSAFWGFLRMGDAAFYGDFVNSFGAGGGYTTPDEITIAAHDNHLPVPIFTLTALDAPCAIPTGQAPLTQDQLKKMPLQERMKFFRPTGNYVVEVSPQGWGSDRLGYTTEWPIQFNSMEYWARSSGAFIDYPNLGSCPLTKALGASWGQWLPVPASQDAASPTRFFGVDGGFAENLAAFPLFRRSCKLVAIIDSELDPYLEFEGYQILQAGLWESLQTTLEVPDIESWLNTPVRPYGRPNATNPDLSIVRLPLYPGAAREANGNLVDVMYLKLTLDPAKEGQYSNDTMTEFRSTGLCGDAVKKDCDFPHTPTIQTAYRPEQFRAHRDLGAALIRLHLAPAIRDYVAAHGSPDRPRIQPVEAAP